MMLRLLPLSLPLLCVCVSAVSPSDAANETTIAEAISEPSYNLNLTTLSSLLASGHFSVLDEKLSSPGNFTLFAPSDAALKGVDPSDVDLLTNVLMYHVMGEAVMSSSITEAPLFVESLLTNSSFVNKGEGVGQAVKALVQAGAVKINEATVVKADIVCTNGVIHIIDTLLLPPKKTSVVAQNANLTSLVDALLATDLVDTVDDTASLTIFAPANAAFSALNLSSLNHTLKSTLLYHVVPDIRYSTGLEAGKLTTAEGHKIVVRINGTRIFVDDAEVIATDILTENAVVHVIDAVLSPTHAPSDGDGGLGAVAILGIVIAIGAVVGGVGWCLSRRKRDASSDYTGI